ncbi:unnamed protein product, partial [Dicrocoelium dendriticum]
MFFVENARTTRVKRVFIALKNLGPHSSYTTKRIPKPRYYYLTRKSVTQIKLISLFGGQFQTSVYYTDWITESSRIVTQRYLFFQSYTNCVLYLIGAQISVQE